MRRGGQNTLTPPPQGTTLRGGGCLHAQETGLGRTTPRSGVPASRAGRKQKSAGCVGLWDFVGTAAQTCPAIFLPCLGSPAMSSPAVWQVGKSPSAGLQQVHPPSEGLVSPLWGDQAHPWPPRTPLCSNALVDSPAQCPPAFSPVSPCPGTAASGPLLRAPGDVISGLDRGPCRARPLGVQMRTPSPRAGEGAEPAQGCGMLPGLTEVHARALFRAPGPQEDVSSAGTLSTAYAEPAQLALEEAELRILILAPRQEGWCLLRADGSGQWLPATCAVEGVHVSSRRLAMYGLGSASVTCLHGPQRPHLPAGHPPLGECPQNSLPQQGLWGSSKSAHRCPMHPQQPPRHGRRRPTPSLSNHTGASC